MKQATHKTEKGMGVFHVRIIKTEATNLGDFHTVEIVSSNKELNGLQLNCRPEELQALEGSQ